MGDAAEAILNGEDCQECGVYMGPGEGYPRTCDGCDQEGSAVVHHDPDRRQRGFARRTHRDVAGIDFQEAQQLAAVNGLRLRRCSEAHYQLIHLRQNWLMNLYPGNRRLYGDPNRKPPYLRVQRDWSLADVVRAAISHQKKADDDEA